MTFPRDVPESEMVDPRVCEVCGKDFQPSASAIKRGAVKVCSPACAGAAGAAARDHGKKKVAPHARPAPRARKA